jgi:hypothetical protein
MLEETLFAGDCVTGLVCRCLQPGCGSNGACVSLREVGQNCADPNTVCVPGSTCQSGTCVGVDQLRGLAEACGA